MSELRAVARLQIKDGKFEDFSGVVKQIMAVVAKESGTTGYDWFINEETGEVRVLETYADSDAIIAHAGGEAVPHFGRLFEVADLVGVEVFGDFNDAAREAVAAFNAVHFGAPAFSK